MKICITSFVSGKITCQEGTLARDNDPRVTAMPDAFVDVESRVEQATARPGETRNVKVPAKKTAATKKD